MATRPIFAAVLLWVLVATARAAPFEGRFYRGEGDAEYLQLLDISRRMFDPDEQYQNMAMLYSPRWNGFVEGPKWDAWWIQNSYGPTYCALPFYDEPYTTFLQNAQDLWFKYIGDGKPYKSPFGGHQYTPPDGQLCDCATTDGALHKQGDGRVGIHDFGLEFTAAGVVMQAELLLVSRDLAAIGRYLPLLERCANLIETRRDPRNNLFLAGAAANLLAPSYAGFHRSDGTYDKAYLAGLSVTYIASLDRLIELEKLAGRDDKARLYTDRRELARSGLSRLSTDEGYFVKYIDPDGTKHGVYGAARHGYFEAVVNHDAICFRVADDLQSRRIYQKLASIPGLRPHKLIITNYPSLDDQYESGGIFGFGIWVNGGHWSTCEARMIMAYARLGQHADIVASMHQLMTFARAFRMDNPLTDCGGDVWFKGDPIHLCYDSFGAPAAMIRGLYEYLYSAEGVRLVPHIPPGITRLEQHFPIRLGPKRIYLASYGTGPVTGVQVNGRPWRAHDAESISLAYAELPDRAVVQIMLGGAQAAAFAPRPPSVELPALPADASPVWNPKWPVISTNKLPLRIGADSDTGSRFIGDIRRARIYSRPLSDAEILKLSKEPVANLDADAALVGDWSFDRGGDGLFASAAAADMPAKIVGKVVVVDTPTGRAVRLDGSGYLEVAHHPKLDLAESCTLDAWICPKQMGQGGGRIIDKSRVGTSNGYLLDTHPGNSIRVIVEQGALAQDAKLAADRWYHVAATVDSAGLRKLYVDGRPVASSPGEAWNVAARLKPRLQRIVRLHGMLVEAGLADGYEAAHLRVLATLVAATNRRLEMLASGKLEPLPPASQVAADRSYYEAAARLCEGLEKLLDSYEKATDGDKRAIHAMWRKSNGR